ncbi:MAG: hypothetical protein GF388_06425 [Candidatus Aegiribacteria sp.]|nr:hypothetical protein [Candidatus Aegiribacteria sp.]
MEAGPDLNGDGISEIAVAGDNAGTLCFDGATGNTLWSYPSGSNTWSVAWADSVYMAGVWTPCIVGGSVNGKRITLCDAFTGDLIWEQSFTERVYNVSTMYMETLYDCPIVFAGLQDQQSQPFHAWAFLSSDGTSVEGNNGVISPAVIAASPACGVLLLTPPEGEWTAGVYDLSGRLLWRDEIASQTSVDVSGWSAGCYLLRMNRGDLELRRTLTVLK